MVNGTNIYSSSINSTHLLDGTINADDLGTNSVSDDEIDYSVVTLSKFTNDANFLDKDDGGTIDGSLIINGNLSLIGSYLNATITNQYLNGSFFPSITNLFDLGSSSFIWNNLYLTKIFATDWTNVTITESQISDLQSYLTSESDPTFTAWDKDYSDLINSPTVPTIWDESFNNTGDAKWGGSSDTQKQADGSYLYNDTTTIYLNETKLNNTIDNKITGITGDNSSWNESYADTQYLGIEDQTYNETTLILSINTTSNLMSLGFYNETEVDNLISSTGNSSFNQTLTDTLYYSINNPLNFLNQTQADLIYAPINYGDDWNKTYADTLYADISVAGDNSSWNESYADTLYMDINEVTGNSSFNQTLTDELYAKYQFGANNFNGSGNFTTSGRIGIGTETPGGKLVVSQPITNGIILRLSGSSDVNGFDFIRADSDGALSIQGNQLGFNNINLAPTSGNVGIGTTAPSAKLDVAGNVNLNNTLYVNETSGNVGIGTTSPEYKLDIISPTSEARNVILKGSVEDDANSAFYIASGTSTAGEFRPGFIGIKKGDANSPLTFYGRIDPTYDTGTNALVRFVAQTWTGDDVDGTTGTVTTRPLFQFLGSGITSPMTILANGNVGIGTTTPQQPLNVIGDGNFTGNLDVGGNVSAHYFTGDGSQLTGITGDNSSWNKTYADTLYADISITGDNSSWNESYADTLYAPVNYGDDWNKTYADTLYMDINEVTGNSSFNQTLTDELYAKYQFENNNFNGSGNITTSGRVGIGTDSPTFPLEVVDSSVPMSVVRSAAFTNTLLTTFSGAHKTSGDMVDGFGPMLNFRIEDNDGVTNNYIGGIGAMRDGHDKSGAIVIRNYLEGVSAERMRVSANGNVGIGTDSPDSLLHVNGISEFEGIINTNGNWISGDGGAEGLSVDSDGNVGILTKTPLAKLHISTGTNFALMTGADVNKDTVTTDYRKFNRIGMPSYSTVKPVNMIIGDSNELYNKLFFGGGTSLGYAATQIEFMTAADTTTVTGTTAMTIDSSQNVGIGTIEPATKLDVNGSVHITDLEGTYDGGSAFVCVWNNGTIYASEAVCP